MGTLHHVMHTGARPIGLLEFMDAVRAACKPRFPHARGLLHRQVAVAVSGGVDSMALAFLCSQIRKRDHEFKISDNPVSSFCGLVVDHGLRPGSREEALAVCKALRRMDFMGELLALNWSRALGDSYNRVHPKELPNFESVARTLRYQKLGSYCAYRNIASLLLAHHEDDQYETVLMRLLQGHGSRGLRGMRKARDIPECWGLFGADGSGYVDDQMREYPFYKTTPSKGKRKHMRRELKSNIRHLVAGIESNEHSTAELSGGDLDDPYQSKRAVPFNIDIEDGGVTVYRPLLEFSKDRLIATCLENNVPWWEDATNKDPTLTIRNAVRHLYKGYTLPKALQKPSIIALSKRSERRVQAQEDAANRLLSRTIIHDLEVHAGTATVQFPKLLPRLARRDSRSPLRRRARLLKQREIAAIFMRKILELVSPESQPPFLPTLENHVSRLFPSLALLEEAAAANPPKAFSVSGVFLIPIMPNTGSTSIPEKTANKQQQLQQLSWYLSRTPYPSHRPLPRVRTTYWATERDHNNVWMMSPRMPWALWDGRYWIHIEHRLPYRLIVQPFLLEHGKSFRELLTPDDRDLLAAFLKKYAPGKVRYTLPAIYLEEHLDLDNVVPRPSYPNPIYWDDGDGNRRDEEERRGSLHPKVLDNSKMKLVALPTLGIQIPGLDQWLSYEIRYRKADRDTLQKAGTFHRGSFMAPGALKKRVMRSGVSATKLRRR
ncbi:adenine nucleotide alpha hydrolases-like protein [Hypoxylon sp. FL1857]|nr:adenine nucleotide alpha hydrolases-like protein [Hypoxylon sp. FL1857]